MSKFFQKCVNVLLVFAMLLTSISSIGLTVHADQTSVEIVSFVRQTNDGLRSSELLEAKVTGYDGNISDLTFTWSNNLGTYLYIYNSSNMYNIKDTAGEIELDGKSVEWEWVWEEDSYLPSIERVEKDGETVAAKGYAWAAVYGANLGDGDLDGTISVTVTDAAGNVIGSASYTNFLKPVLSEDLIAVNYGVFEGETINVKDMFGRSSIVHIDCKECYVSDVEVVSGGEYITLESQSSGNYYVTGKTSGVASITLSVRKDNCKFHQNSGAQKITNNVYVFKKPVTSTTTTTIELTNIDPNCDYFIGNVQGVEYGNDKVVFTGLTPDTTYEITVRGNYQDGYAYAYVSDTTDPTFKASVNFYTDNKLADSLEYFEVGDQLYLKEASGDSYINLEHTSVGVYSADVDNGIYHIYFKEGSSYRKFDNYQLTIDSENNVINIHTYSLRYNLNGGSMDSTGGIYHADSAVYATSEVPVKAKSSFLYWTDEAGIEYKPGQLITQRITGPIVLTAHWEEAVDVKVNVTIDHTYGDGVDVADGMHNATFRLVKLENDSSVPASNEVTITPTSCNGYTYSFENNVSKYISNSANFEGSKGAQYTISCAKTGYDLESVTQTVESDGSIVLDVKFKYQPKNLDLGFDVVMADSVSPEFYPAGVNVKVTYWGYDASWQTITQHENVSLYIGIDDSGKGHGSYPVWKSWSDNASEPYYYSIDVISYVLADGTIVTNANDAYVTAVTIEGEGEIPSYPVPGTLEGAYFDASNVQKGIPTATISIKSYNLTFDANGGVINGSDKYTVNNQVVIPDLLGYVPTRNGGYRFAGWYTDKTFATEAKSGARLLENTTLYAKWDDPISVSGTITVDAFYYQGNDRIQVLPEDRADTLVTTLQVKNNGTYNDVLSVSSELTYVNDVATVDYSFKNIKNALSEGIEYRIRTSLINYETLYNNDNKDPFTAEEYTADFSNSNDAKVDAHLVFVADEFSQNYEIDATLIGEGFRPQTGISQILFQTKGSNPPNTVISQHSVAPYGEVLDFENGVATDSVKLWKGISNGAISSYQLRVTSIDEEEYTDESPYTVRYGATTSWSTADGSAGTLKATLIPKEYKVTLDLNTTDEVGNMSAFASKDGDSYFIMHKWSHNTPVAAVPTRDGYVFMGWKAENEADFDGRYVQASVEKDITLTAIWAEFSWVTDKDSGYVEKESGKESVVRFLFDVATTDELKSKITETGIKFIRSGNIGDKVEDSNVAGSALTGSSTTFYGDIINIPTANAGQTYYAIAYVVCNGETHWSLPVECQPNFTDLISYE